MYAAEARNMYKLLRAKVAGKALKDKAIKEPEIASAKTVRPSLPKKVTPRAVIKPPTAMAKARKNSRGSERTLARKLAQLLAGSSGKSPAHVLQNANIAIGMHTASSGCGPDSSMTTLVMIAASSAPPCMQLHTSTSTSEPPCSLRITSEYLPSQSKSKVAMRMLAQQKSTATTQTCEASMFSNGSDASTEKATKPITDAMRRYPRLWYRPSGRQSESTPVKPFMDHGMRATTEASWKPPPVTFICWKYGSMAEVRRAKAMPFKPKYTKPKYRTKRQPNVRRSVA
mmetsp:Transcript_105768/g.207436  ORF Transcript_105768/g.207436 Transcript_105768/m.207436 type:complete len:285 (+) Transcript_105768:853-1707(+)